MFPPYFCFRFRLYGPPDGHFCLIFARMGWQSAPDGTIWERGISCTTLITLSVEEFYIRLCRLYFLIIAHAYSLQLSEIFVPGAIGPKL